MIVLTCTNLVPFMGKRETDKAGMHTQDKQLRGLSIEVATEKRCLDQALNAKEFALCAGVSYSTARHWFHLPGFPVFHGVVFWQDFVHWRMSHYDVVLKFVACGAGQSSFRDGVSATSGTRR